VFQNKLIDRFGPMPCQSVDNSIKWIAAGGIELVMKQGKMIGYFISDQQSDYYQSKRFHQVLFVQKTVLFAK
jgi:transcription-repair coupling factor (superfamily II helicase)